MINRAAVRKIGVFHLNQLGDLMFSLPVLASLRSGFETARVVSVLHEGLAGLLSNSSWVDSYFTHRRSKDVLLTGKKVRQAGFDLVVCLSQSPRVMLLAASSGARVRIGFSGHPMSRLLTHRVEKTTVPSLANNLRLIRSLGLAPVRTDYRGLLTVSPEDRREAERILTASGIGNDREILVMGPGASDRRRHKEWPLERFVEVARQTVGNDMVAAIVGLERRLEDRYASEGIFDLGGRTSLRSLAAILERARLFVGIDSGVLHLAASMGVPCVALFGPTDPEITGPRGTSHLVIHRPEAEGGLEALPSCRVVEAVEELWARCA